MSYTLQGGIVLETSSNSKFLTYFSLFIIIGGCFFIFIAEFNGFGNYSESNYFEKSDIYSGYAKNVKLSESSSLYWNNKGVEAGLQKDYNQARTFLKKSQEIDDNYAVQNNLGIIEYNLGNYKTALDHYKKSISMNENNLDIYYNMGNLYINMNDPFSASKYFKHAANIEYENSNYENAIHYYDIALSISPIDVNSRVPQWLEERRIPNYEEKCLLYGNLYQQKATAMEKLSNYDKTEASMNYVLAGRCFHKCGLYNESIKSYDNAIKIDKENHMAYYEKGESYKQLKHYDLAHQTYEEGIKNAGYYIQFDYEDKKIFFDKNPYVLPIILLVFTIIPLNQLRAVATKINERREYTLDNIDEIEQLISSYDSLNEDGHYMKALMQLVELSRALDKMHTDVSNRGDYKFANEIYDVYTDSIKGLIHSYNGIAIKHKTQAESDVNNKMFNNAIIQYKSAIHWHKCAYTLSKKSNVSESITNNIEGMILSINNKVEYIEMLRNEVVIEHSFNDMKKEFADLMKHYDKYNEQKIVSKLEKMEQTLTSTYNIAKRYAFTGILDDIYELLKQIHKQQYKITSDEHQDYDEQPSIDPRSNKKIHMNDNVIQTSYATIEHSISYSNGNVILKILIINSTTKPLTDITLQIYSPNQILQFIKYTPEEYDIINGKLTIPNIEQDKTVTLNVYFEPVNLSKNTSIDCSLDVGNVLDDPIVFETSSVVLSYPLMLQNVIDKPKSFNEYIRDMPYTSIREYKLNNHFKRQGIIKYVDDIVDEMGLNILNIVNSDDYVQYYVYGQSRHYHEWIFMSFVMDDNMLQVSIYTQNQNHCLGTVAHLNRSLKKIL